MSPDASSSDVASTASSTDETEHHAQVARPSDSLRDTEDLRERLERWMAGKVPSGSTVTVADVTLPAANGMSSETILFDATWDGEHHPLVARVAPTESTMPVFPAYDLESQFRTMAQVREHSAVPVPAVYWSESDPDALGAPFFVMERISGDVPPDVMPYNFGSWVTEASPEQRKTLQRSSVDVLAQLHAIDKPGERFDFLRLPNSERLHEKHSRRTSPSSARTTSGWSPTGSDHRSSNVPSTGSRRTILRTIRRQCSVGGDSRIGNVMYQDFAPVAVLDWEMATLGRGRWIWLDGIPAQVLRGHRRTGEPTRSSRLPSTAGSRADLRRDHRPHPHTIWSSTLPMPHCVRRSSCGESRLAP